MRYGLIGEKLGHSFSKEIHELLGDYEYCLKELKPEELEEFLKKRGYFGCVLLEIRKKGGENIETG